MAEWCSGGVRIEAFAMSNTNADLEPTHGRGRRPELELLRQPPIALADGDIVPAVLTLETDRLSLTVPVGSYMLRQGKPCFVPTVDVVGLTAAAMGIGVGALAVVKWAPVMRALVERIGKG
jgi:hypothetical protein